MSDGLLIVGAIVVLVLLIVAVRAKGHQRIQALVRLIKEFGGWVPGAANPLGPVALEFTHCGFPMVLTLVGQRRERHRDAVRLELFLPGAGVTGPMPRLCVVTPGEHPDLGERLHLAPHKTGDPLFDERFVVLTESPQIARKALPPSARESLTQLSDLFDTPPLYLVLNAFSLRIVHAGLTDSEWILSGTVARGIGIAQEMLEALGVGRAPVPYLMPGGRELPPRPGMAAQLSLDQFRRLKLSCPICGHPVEDALVRCRTCLVPTHQDCWDNLRRCPQPLCEDDAYERV